MTLHFHSAITQRRIRVRDVLTLTAADVPLDCPSDRLEYNTAAVTNDCIPEVYYTQPGLFPRIRIGTVLSIGFIRDYVSMKIKLMGGLCASIVLLSK